MRIFRHSVGADRLRAATDDFAARVSREVDRQRYASRTSADWSVVATYLLDYAGARSVERPELDRDIRTAVYSAAEAYVGAVALGGYSPHRAARVFLSYTNTGVSYAAEPAEEHGSTPRLAPADWMAALYLVVIAGAECRHAVTLLETTAATSLSSEELAFADHVLDEPANRETVPAAPARVLDRLDNARTGGESELGTALRALVKRDRDEFWTALGAMLATHRGNHGDDPPPRSLLPLAPIALAALAVRNEGWDLAIDSAYLPAKLVTGNASGERARTAPTLGHPARVERPCLHVPAQHLAFLDEGANGEIEHAVSSRVQLDLLPQTLAWTMDQQIRRFRLRSAHDPDGRDPRQRAAIAIASQSGAAIFRVATAPGEHVDVTIGHVTAPLRRTGHTTDASGLNWRTAVCAALLVDDVRSLDALVTLHPRYFAAEHTLDTFRYYRDALHDYLRGADATAAADRALWARERAAASKPDMLTPPAALLSQLVAGDPGGFAHTLVEELEEHRDHFTAADNADDPAQLVNLDILALARHATAKGWPLPVRSGYLPEAFLTR
ncbi:hypothetical protein F4561_006204 [Lipingzhangella halophila]|uniref:Immunity protein 49 of polymorphic toxin system n=1 Tax=Lipingzhangella halophila TaxID=1783352 RepID=A0A7W7W6Y2_9ACTN|nr:immunity 49 family protein [Lipingzhangella halophila]MBB4935310.1 hypothetical protein [Lipingzhangella halophila]